MSVVLGKNVVENKHTEIQVSSINRLINNCKTSVKAVAL